MQMDAKYGQYQELAVQQQQSKVKRDIMLDELVLALQHCRESCKEQVQSLRCAPSCRPGGRQTRTSILDEQLTETFESWNWLLYKQSSCFLPRAVGDVDSKCLCDAAKHRSACCSASVTHHPTWLLPRYILLYCASNKRQL